MTRSTGGTYLPIPTHYSMNYLRSAMFGSRPTKPSPLHKSATPEPDQHEETESSSNLLRTPWPDALEDELPPFTPSADDHISLSLVPEGKEDDGDSINEARENQQEAHSALVDRFAQDCPSRPLERSRKARSHDAITSRRSNAELRRSSTDPAPAPRQTLEEFMEIKEPTPKNIDLPLIDSKLGLEDGSSMSTISDLSDSRDRAELFQHDLGGIERSHSEKDSRRRSRSRNVPWEIRLRKPTEPRISPMESISSLSSLTSARDGDDEQEKSTETHQETPQWPIVYRKSSLAEAAVTRTAVHLFGAAQTMESANNSSESIISTGRVSATLQVVRSPDSVYEIIWEDNRVVQPQEQGEESHHTPETAQAVEASDNKYWQTNTELAAWSWGANYHIENGIEELTPHTLEARPSTSSQQDLDSGTPCVPRRSRKWNVGKSMPEPMMTVPSNSEILTPKGKSGPVRASRKEELVPESRNCESSSLAPEAEGSKYHHDPLLPAQERALQDDIDAVGSITNHSKPVDTLAKKPIALTRKKHHAEQIPHSLSNNCHQLSNTHKEEPEMSSGTSVAKLLSQSPAKGSGETRRHEGRAKSRREGLHRSSGHTSDSSAKPKNRHAPAPMHAARFSSNQKQSSPRTSHHTSKRHGQETVSYSSVRTEASPSPSQQGDGPGDRGSPGELPPDDHFQVLDSVSESSLASRSSIGKYESLSHSTVTDSDRKATRSIGPKRIISRSVKATTQ